MPILTLGTEKPEPLDVRLAQINQMIQRLHEDIKVMYNIKLDLEKQIDDAKIYAKMSDYQNKESVYL